MKRRLVSEYSSFAILFCVVFLLYFRLWLFALLLYVLWYLLFGMVGLAFSYSVKRKLGLSNFFIKISIPIILVPFRKAFYYWTKAVNVILADSAEAPKAYVIAKKVNPDSLYTDNNRCMFFSFFAALLNDMGDKEKALYYLGKAEQLPHNAALDDTLKKMRGEILG